MGRLTANDNPIPRELQNYDAERWRAEAAAHGESGGSLRYFAALRRAGVAPDIAHALRADACVVDLRAERVARIAGGAAF